MRLDSRAGRGKHFQIDRSRTGPRVVVIERAQVGIRVPRVELVVERFFRGTRRALHPGITRGFLHGDDLATGNQGPAIVQHQGHSHWSAALGAGQRQGSGHGGGACGGRLGHGDSGDAPGIVQIGDTHGLQSGQVRDVGSDRDGLAAIPGGGSGEREHRIGNALVHRDGDVDGFGFRRIDGLEQDVERLVARAPGEA